MLPDDLRLAPEVRVEVSDEYPPCRGLRSALAIPNFEYRKGGARDRC